MPSATTKYGGRARTLSWFCCRLRPVSVIAAQASVTGRPSWPGTVTACACSFRPICVMRLPRRKDLDDVAVADVDSSAWCHHDGLALAQGEAIGAGRRDDRAVGRAEVRDDHGRPLLADLQVRARDLVERGADGNEPRARSAHDAGRARPPAEVRRTLEREGLTHADPEGVQRGSEGRFRPVVEYGHRGRLLRRGGTPAGGE